MITMMKQTILKKVQKRIMAMSKKEMKRNQINKIGSKRFMNQSKKKRYK